jgi:hypothetical protein
MQDSLLNATDLVAKFKWKMFSLFDICIL